MGFVFSGIANTQRSALAQVTPDSTLSTTVTSADNLNFVIEDGQRAGDNLFHSFEDFSIPTGGEAYFNNAANIQTIFSRVTGQNRSDIDGLIQANGTADLFLLNPNGILFGPNAQLNIGGSFIGSTAESVVFEDNREFSATTPSSSLLTISTPIGLQMGQNPQSITIQGQGHTHADGLAGDFFDRTSSSRGVTMTNGATLGFIGGDILFDSGVLTAEGGTIALGAFGADTLVALDLTDENQPFRYDGMTPLSSIQLDERSLLDASEGGHIYLQGQTIELLNGSTLLIQNSDLTVLNPQTNQDIPGGQIRIESTDTVVLEGNSLDGRAISAVRSENQAVLTGPDIVINTQDLVLRDGGSIGSNTASSATGGTVQVHVEERFIADGFAAGNPLLLSVLASLSSAQGTAGDVLVETNRLNLSNGGAISSTTSGEGQGGKLTVNAATSVTASGGNPFITTPSTLNVVSLGDGDAGQLTINTKRINLEDGGGISSSTLVNGAAGDIFLNASESIQVRGQFVSGSGLSTRSIPSAILAASDLNEALIRQLLGLPPLPTGASGNLVINTPTLHVLDGGLVSVRNDSNNGNAGSLKIQADTIRLESQGSITAPANGGQGGDIILDVDQLAIYDGAQINASTQTGQGGSIGLTLGDSLTLENQGEILANAQQDGQGGNIRITAPTILVRQGSSIATNVTGTAAGGEVEVIADYLSITSGSNLSVLTSGSGQAGNITLQVRDLNVSGMGEIGNAELGSQVIIPSFVGAGTLPGSSGHGGNLMITGDRLRVTDGGLIGAGTFGSGASGDVTIYASKSLEVSGIGDFPAAFFGFLTAHPSRISASSIGDAPAGSVRIEAPVLSITDGAILEVNVAGNGEGGDLELVGDRLFLTDNGSLQAQVAGGDQGNISLNMADAIILQRDSQITTNAINEARGGDITIAAPFLIGFDNSDIIANAVQGSGGNIDITAQSLFGLEFRDRLTPNSDITASSEFGVNGTVTITNLDVDPHSDVMELSNAFTDADSYIATSCLSVNSSFIATGRGGIPVQPTDTLSQNHTWADTRDLSDFLVRGREGDRLSPTMTTAPNEETLIEATTWHTNADGQLELVTVHRNHPDLSTHATCATST